MALLAIASVAVLLLPWWSERFLRAGALSRRAANVAAYRSRERELEEDLRAGLLVPETAARVREESAGRLVQDAAPEPEAASAAESRWLPLTAALALVLGAVAWYAAAGSWRSQQMIALSESDPEAGRVAATRQAIEQLRTHLASNPGDAEAWAWLGRAQSNLGVFSDAVEAFASANRLAAEPSPEWLVGEGEARLQVGEAPAAAVLFGRALAVAPDYAPALWNAGVAALHLGDAAGALRPWERLLAQPLPDDVRVQLERSVAALREQVPAPAGPRLVLDVELAPGLGPAPPDHVLLVYALAPDGSRAPLAVRRLPGRLPQRVTLDDGDGMLPGRSLSSYDRWRVIARLGPTGSAQAQAGDLEGELTLSRGQAASARRLVINRRLAPKDNGGQVPAPAQESP